MRLNQIYEAWHEQVDFYCVYIQEAHPEDGWQLPSNVEEDIVFEQPTTIEERASVAEACVLQLRLAMPTLLDGIDNATDRAYAALPERLYLVDAGGTVVHQSGPGPWGFDVDAWEQAIREHLALP